MGLTERLKSISTELVYISKKGDSNLTYLGSLGELSQKIDASVQTLIAMMKEQNGALQGLNQEGKLLQMVIRDLNEGIDRFQT